MGIEFRSQRTLAQFIEVNYESDICVAVLLIAPHREIMTETQFLSRKRVIERLQSTHAEGLYYIKLDMNPMRFVVFLNVAFANDPGFGNPLEYVLSVTNKKRNEIVVHYGSRRCQRITLSILAAKVYALILAGDV